LNHLPAEPAAERRREQRRCTRGNRFEVGHYGESHAISVPKGTENNLIVEIVAGLEPETDGSG
jgi:glutamine synthetase type III